MIVGFLLQRRKIKGFSHQTKDMNILEPLSSSLSFFSFTALVQGSLIALLGW